MAVKHPVLASQLVSKLEDKDEDLQKRFKLAELVFSSLSVNIIRKEEIIIEWLANTIKEIGCEGSSMPYDVLNNCVSGSRLLSLSLELRRNVIDLLIEALEAPVNAPNNAVNESRRQCIISILSSPYFQNMFYRDVKSLSTLLKEFCLCYESATNCNATELKKVCHILNEFGKHCLLHEDLRFSFINEMMTPLCRCVVKLVDGYKICEEELHSCMNMIYIESDITDKFIELYHSKKNEEDHQEDSFTYRLVRIIKKLPSTQDVEVVRIIFTLFLKTVFNNNRDKHSKVFNVFTLLCGSLGITVKGMVSIGMKPKKNWTREETFSVISSMVETLDDMKLSIDCTIENDVTLQVWFTSLIIGLTNIQGKDLSPEFIRMMKSIFKFNLLIIQNVHKPLFNQIMLCEKSDDNIKKEYVDLLKLIFDGSLQISRLQKFISKFLMCFEEYLQFSNSNNLFSVDDVFPKEIKDDFCDTVSKMPGSQVLSTTKSLQYHLHIICTTKLESSGSDFESDVIISLEIISHLLNLFLNGVKIVDFNTPAIVKDKFASIVEDIGKTLDNFSEIILDRKHNDRLMACLLELCLNIGSSTLLMWEYDRDGRRIINELDWVPTNLNYIHSYIDHHSWESIAKRVSSSGNDTVKNLFYMLIVQKMNAISQIVEGANSPSTESARYLLINASPSWHWDNATSLAPLLEDNELLGLLEVLIKSAGLDHTKWIPFVSSNCFSRNKRLVVAASTGLLSAMSRHIQKNRKNGAVSFRVMSKVAVVPLLEYELSRLFEDNEDLEGDLRCFFEEIISELESYLLEDPPPAPSNEDLSIGGFVEIITKISYEECSYAMEICMLIAIISLLCDIPIGTNNDIILLDKLCAFLREPRSNPPAFLLNVHSGALLRFLVKRTEHYPNQKNLIQLFCNFSMSTTNRLLLKYVKTPTVSTLWQTTSVIRSLHVTKLGKEDDTDGSRIKCITKLLSSAVPLLEKEEASVELLNDYVICFDVVLKLNDQNMCQFFSAKLLKKLKKYLILALSNFEKGRKLIKLCFKRSESLSSQFPKNFLLELWNKVFKVQDTGDSNILHTFFSSLSKSELQIVLADMLTMFEDGIREETINYEGKIKRSLFLWKGVIWADLDVDQKKEIVEAIDRFISSVMELVQTWSSQSNPVVGPILDYLAELGHCPSFQTFGSHLLDSYLVILGQVPLEGTNALKNLNSGLDALVALFMFRRALIIDRLPPFLQIFRLYAQSLGKLSTQGLTFSNLCPTELCADKLARAAEIMLKHKKDFVRLAPYIISDILSIFEKHTLHPEIKVHFVNILSSFFSILDDHGSTYLSSALNPACQELYKTYFDQYTRYMKYHGKI